MDHANNIAQVQPLYSAEISGNVCHISLQQQRPGGGTPTKAGPSAPPSFWSPSKSRSSGVSYSDRFIPSRSASARLDYSLLDREAATSDANRKAAGREVRGHVCRDQVTPTTWILVRGGQAKPISYCTVIILKCVLWALKVRLLSLLKE